MGWTADDAGPEHLVREALRSLALDVPDAGAVRRAVDTAHEHLVTSAIAQGTGPALAAFFEESDMVVPPELRIRVENARFARTASIEVLRHVGVEFESSGIPFVALKGAVLASMYRRPELRMFNDIDLLVNGDDMGAALDALGRIGASDINRNWGNYLEHGVAETPVWTPGIGIDLHWHVVGLARDRRDIRLAIDEMIGRRRTVDLGGLDVWTLDPTDLLLHVALHAGRAGATRLLWLRDIRELVRAEPPDWPMVVDRARRAGIDALIGQVLDRARVELDAAVPDEVCARLCPRPLLAARRTVDRRDGGRGLPTRFARGLPVTVSRRSALGTSVALARTLTDRVRTDQRWDVGDATGPLYWNHPSGGETGRQDYLAYAARTR